MTIHSVAMATGILPDAASILHAFGPWVLGGIALLIFIESGALFPFLPGDSLLVTAAVLAGPLGIQPWQVLLVGIPAAILGDQVGYWLGRRFGRRLFREDARVLRPERLHDAERFFTRYGGGSLVLGRFVPIVRTYVPVAAGTAHMHYRRFLLWNTLGATLWVVAMTLIGLLLGGIPFIVDNIDVLMIVIVLISVLPVIIAIVRKTVASRRARAAAEADWIGDVHRTRGRGHPSPCSSPPCGRSPRALAYSAKVRTSPKSPATNEEGPR